MEKDGVEDADADADADEVHSCARTMHGCMQQPDIKLERILCQSAYQVAMTFAPTPGRSAQCDVHTGPGKVHLRYLGTIFHMHRRQVR